MSNTFPPPPALPRLNPLQALAQAAHARPFKPINHNISTRRGRIIIEDVEGDEFEGDHPRNFGVERVMKVLADVSGVTLAKVREVYDQKGCLCVVWRENRPATAHMVEFEEAWSRLNEHQLEYTFPDGTVLNVDASFVCKSTRQERRR